MPAQELMNELESMAPLEITILEITDLLIP